MPTAKPRITVTLEPHSHEILSRLSAVSGDSMSQIVAGFVEMAIPSLERVVAIMEKAKSAPDEFRAGLRASIDRADRALIPTLEHAIGEAQAFLSEAAGNAPLGAQNGGSTPVPVTRGSGRPKRAIRGSRTGATSGAL